MKTHETDLSTEQNSPKTKIRFSSTNENNIGTQTHQPPSQGGPRNSKRLTFSKADRLLVRRDFRRLSKEGRRLVSQRLCIDYAKAFRLRLGITAPVRYGSSPERNRFKRLVREAFRLNYFRLPKGLTLNISPRKLAKNATFADIQNEIIQLLCS